ncbi:hypothetical protein [Hymenobacter crusticola]|uniref:Uncharacterized protein n=1 Tax=Hymenobacter crusticola TaxID=1770526 RepID=A0A243W6B7_9BACT|nr:hypothetical protein [Hymenobacter crusticola]OUJ69501.1 hypothetical protein BXP70_26320 [Hymenobacter crusticola]
MNFTSFETHELIALTKALGFVKFESQEAGASAVAGSPLLGQILDQAAQTLWAKEPKYYAAHQDWPAVTVVPEALAAIRFHLTQVAQWHNVADHNRIAYIRDLVFPLKATEQTVQELLRFANDYHRPAEPVA